LLQSVVAFAFVLSFAVTFGCTRYFTALLGRMGIAGVDGHKPHKPHVPEMGGTAILLGYSVALPSAALIYLHYAPGFDLTPVAAALGVFLIAGAIGVVDDLRKLSHRVKPLLLLAAAAPLVLLRTGVAEVRLPFLTVDFAGVMGHDLSLLYWLVVVPLGVTGAANVTNMLAGFNGLMSGLGVVSCATLAVISVYLGQPAAALVFAAMAGAQLAFLYFNRYPARVFPGDAGTLSLGALVAAGLVIGNIEFLGVVVLLPQIVNASMSLLSVGRFFEEKQFREEKMSALNVTSDGLISFTRLEKPITLCKILLYNRPQREYALVFKVIILSVISALLALWLAVAWG